MRSSPGRSTLIPTSSRSRPATTAQCGSPLRASYDDERLAIDCPACGRTHGEYSFPPGGLLDRHRDEILTAFDRRVRRLHGLARDGICPACSGRVRTEIVREGDCCLDVDLRAEYSCDQCHHSRCSTVGLALLDQSAVVGFYRDHGIDLESARYWQFDWCVSDEYTTVRSTNPWRIAVSIRSRTTRSRVRSTADYPSSRRGDCEPSAVRDTLEYGFEPPTNLTARVGYDPALEP